MKTMLLLFSILSLCMVSLPSNAKMSVQTSYEFASLCQKRNRNLKNYADICACQKKNFRWLVDTKQWKDMKAIYTEKISREEMKKRDGLSALDFLIVNIENACHKNQSYLAPKARELAKKAKR